MNIVSSSLDDLYLFPAEVQEAVLNGPALDPPQGIVPNFDHPPNMNQLCIALVTVALSLVTIAAALRAYVKIYIVRKLRIEDYIASLAYCAFVGYCYTLYRIVGTVGFQVHQWHYLVRDLNEIVYTVQIAVNCYAIVLMLIKTSILMDWVQIFVPRGTRGRFFWTCCGICCFNFLYYFSGEVASNLNCIPFERIWDKTIPGRCFDRTPLDLTTAAVNVVCDLVILVAPQRVIWRLHLTKQKRAGISIVFAIGLLAIVSAISRLAITVQNSRSSDFTFGMAKVALWSLAELTFSLLLFCIPVIPKAVKESTLPNPLLQMVRSSTSWFKASTGSGWSSSQLQKTPNRGRGYNHMNHEETSLSDLNTARMQPPDQINDVRSDVDRIQLGQGGITLTREFIATEERQDNKEGRLEPEDYHELWDSGRV